MVINTSRTRVIYWKKTLLLPSTYRTYLHLARNNTVIVVHFSQRELLPTFLRDMLVGIVRSIIKQIDTEHHTARNTCMCRFSMSIFRVEDVCTHRYLPYSMNNELHLCTWIRHPLANKSKPELASHRYVL